MESFSKSYTNDDFLVNFKKIPLISFIFGVLCMIIWGFSYINNSHRAILSYFSAYILVLGIVLGSMIFVLLQHISRAGWSVVIRRIPETIIYTMPLFIILCIPIAYNLDVIFPWVKIDLSDIILIKKSIYLNVNFFYIRSIIYLLLWTIIGCVFYKLSVQQDGGFNKENTRKLCKLSAPSIIIFAITTSFASFDWLMSLQPHWFSTIFGIYFFAGNILSALSFITVLLFWLQNNMFLKQGIVNKEHYHDLGKLIFGFTIFWAYIAFSQFMLYWYGNIPEEIEFYLHRLHHGWEYISYLMPITNFIMPFFFLLSRHAKRNIGVLIFSSIWILFFSYMNIFWIIMPNYMHNENDYINFHWIDIICLFGILSLFISYMLFVLNKCATIPTGDPRLQESLDFENF